MKYLGQILLILVVLLAFLTGYFSHKINNGQNANITYTLQTDSKIGKILKLIDKDYYKDVNTDSIQEALIPKILKDLDPHTAYINANQMKKVRESMQGHFSGIGVQFIQYEDTVMVVHPIPKGPSYKAGIKAGYRIVTVDADTIAGRKMSTDSIMNLLKGPANSNVLLGMRIPPADTLKYFKITRGAVNVSTIDIAYMLNDTIGYMRINQFGGQTYYEFVKSILELKKKGAKGLIIDLRGNPGGILSVCVAMLNELLEKDQLIVYTKGRKIPRTEQRANGNGKFKDLPIVVLIDSFSASASEIFSGAIQDHDRGVVVGRRSFGKGLVQNQIDLNDGAALRLTVAEYFTPSGRNIQKPFKKGDRASYDNDINRRYLHGEFAVADSTHFVDSLKYQTDKGRNVYGGGGIMPDVFVPLDTTAYSKYYAKLTATFILRDFAYYFADKHRNILSKLPDYKSIIKHIKKYKYMQKFIKYATKKGVHRDSKGYSKSKELIKNQLLAMIVRNIIDDKSFYIIYNKDDKLLKRGMEVIINKGIKSPN